MNKFHEHNIFLLLLFAFFIIGCQSDKTAEAPSTEPVKTQINIPTVNADNIVQSIEKQLEFGYRIPGTGSHKKCKDWLVSQFESHGNTVKIQSFKASFFDVKNTDAYNIIAQYKPALKKRILLAAHWDSRMLSDQMDDENEKRTPVIGADDGGSGVAVLLEISRILSAHPIDMGIDFILFDAEDQGTSKDQCLTSCSWCLGAQYWAKNKVPNNYKAKFGILLDMVGSKDATFYKEGLSMSYASQYTNKVWQLAQRMGYSDFFIDQRVGGLIDDHKFVNEIAKIPMMNIINTKTGERTFQKCWHKTCDDINGIDRRTLKVVAQVVTASLYRESINKL